MKILDKIKQYNIFHIIQKNKDEFELVDYKDDRFFITLSCDNLRQLAQEIYDLVPVPEVNSLKVISRSISKADRNMQVTVKAYLSNGEVLEKVFYEVDLRADRFIADKAIDEMFEEYKRANPNR